MSPAPRPYDALLLVSFGGPDGPDDVLPFLQNVLEGKNVPPSRLLEVAGHYYRFGGRSPINQQNRDLMAALRAYFLERNLDLPIYWGNRNWHPLLADTVRQMKLDGVHRALALATSAFGCYSGCRQYREDLDQAIAKVGPGAPAIHKLRPFYDHPGFIDAVSQRVLEALEGVPEDRRADARLVFTAHSIPRTMADGSPYVAQLQETCRLVSWQVGRPGTLVYQSRSGPPGQPWLEPDVGAFLRRQHSAGGVQDLVLEPIGFISDHMEVVFDLDCEAAALCRDLGIKLHRAATVGVHPRFLQTIYELILEQIEGWPARRLGNLDTSALCGPACCPRVPIRPGSPR